MRPLALGALVSVAALRESAPRAAWGVEEPTDVDGRPCPRGRTWGTTEPPIILNSEVLESVHRYKYLGVILSRNLCWSPHIQYICRKARKVLGIIYRMVSTNTSYGSTILKLYVALVRPHLEYAAQVWNPHLTKDINCLEKVQKFALRICSKHYHEPYQNLLEYYQLPSLQNRRLFLCLCTFHSIVNGLVYLPNETFLPPAVTVTSRRNGNPHAYRVPHAHLNGLYFSFVCITITLWNNLPLEAINSNDLARFKYIISPMFLCP